MDLVKILSEGTMRAAAEIARTKGVDLGAHVDAAVAAMRAEILAGYDEVVADGQAAIEANMGEAVLRRQLNVACNLFAARALQSIGLLPTP